MIIWKCQFWEWICIVYTWKITCCVQVFYLFVSVFEEFFKNPLHGPPSWWVWSQHFMNSTSSFGTNDIFDRMFSIVIDMYYIRIFISSATPALIKHCHNLFNPRSRLHATYSLVASRSLLLPPCPQKLSALPLCNPPPRQTLFIQCSPQSPSPVGNQ